MNEADLGYLEIIENLREIWEHEAHNFSTWLCKPENMERLSKEIGINVTAIETEAKVGGFSADILAEDDNTKLPVIIENQLEQTNHDHLGKIITYGAEYDANILIWIFKDIRDEHRKAIDWLNEKTNDSLRIFAIKIELYKIGNSKKAPKFNIICSPKGWNPNKPDYNKVFKLTSTQKLQLNFWIKFNEYLSSNGSKLKLRKPLAANWYVFSIGKSNVQINCTVYFKTNILKCDVGIYKEDIFNKIFEKEKEIREQMGLEAEWEKWDEEKKYSVISCQINFDSENNDNEYYYKWLRERCEIYSEIIPKYY